MSLQVWLPLNGNLKNQGVSNAAVTSSGATTNSSGKIGSCYNFNGSSYLSLSTSPLAATNSSYTVAFWAKCSSTNPEACLYSQRTVTTSNQRAIFLYGVKSFLFDEGGRWSPTVTTNYTATNWTHYAFTRSGTSRKIYINGALAASDNTATNATAISTKAFIGMSQDSATTVNSNGFNGQLNDYRIYNTCLSAKEVEELARGLILHYPLTGAPSSVSPVKYSLVPNEYQQVEYIQSTTAAAERGSKQGTYIYLPGYTYDSNTVVKCAFAMTATTGDGKIFGCGGILGLNTLSGSYRPCTPGFNLLSSTTIDTNIHIVECGSSIGYLIDGTQIHGTFSCSSFTGPMLFNLSMTSGQEVTSATSAYEKIYSYQHFQSGQLIMNMIPCYRVSDNKPGLYDTVSGKFFTNSGTGEFILGPKIAARLPHGYQEVEYIESTGTQYINTGYKANNNTRITAHMYDTDPTNEWEKVFGGTYGSGLCFTYYNRISSSDELKYGGAGTNLDRADKRTIKIDANKNIWKINEKSWTSTAQTFQDTADFYIFNMQTTSYKNFIGKLYYFTIYNNGTIARNFIPCYSKSDKKPGLYDLVENKFYINAGTGEFICGPLVKNVPETYYPVEYIQASGTQKIDTGTKFNPATDTMALTYAFTTAARSMIMGNGWNGTNTVVMYLYSDQFSAWARTDQNDISAMYGYASTDSTLDKNKHKAEYKQNKFYIDDRNTGSRGGTFTGQGASNVFLLADAGGSYLTYAKIYDARITSAGKPVRDLRPAVRKSDSVAGMYDLVNDTFYTNAGSGTFSVGPGMGTIEADISGYGRDGVCTTDIGKLYEDPSPRFAGCYKFNSSSYILSTAGDMSWFDFDKCTVSVWLNPTTTPSGWTGSYGVQHANGANKKGFAISNYGGKFTVHTVNGSTYISNSTGSTLTNGQWYHLCATLDGTTEKFYLNGALVDTKTIDWGTSTLSTNARIIANNDLAGSPEYGDARASDLRIYSTALSAAAVQELYKQGRV